ncbi:MAG: sigma-70 family RNA polymerase sigma factor [Gemmatimonadaceae bacterium]|nr:sigma-70 family RNA polymerase sigma factor [Gemmatimonadaceae bacterium]
MTAHDPTGAREATPFATASAPARDDLAELVTIIFHELRRMAHQQLAGEGDHVTLQTTELVHEAYLRLAGHPEVAERGRAYLFASAARAMRQVLVDASRRRSAGKRGDGVAALSLDDQSAAVDAFSDELLDLDDALRNLERFDARAARVVECRFFAGMSVEDTATALGISPRTVKSDWATARRRLREALQDSSRNVLASSETGPRALPETLDVSRAAALLDMPELSDHAEAIERYDVIRQLGRGGTGAVFLARDRHLGHDVALKVLARWLCADPLASQRFLNEVRAVSALESPHIVSIVRSGATDGGQLFIAMQYLEGVTLRERLSAGAISPADALSIASDVADGLRVAHEHGIVHRDIKPENILLTAHGACIVDFGIAKLEGEALTRPGMLLGTAAYMSPEQARGEIVDQRTDLWSLGIVLHEMLTGTRPFRGDDTADVMRSIRSDVRTPVATLPANAPPRLRRVLECCLDKHPDGRYCDAAALQTALTLCARHR